MRPNHDQSSFRRRGKIVFSRYCKPPCTRMVTGRSGTGGFSPRGPKNENLKFRQDLKLFPVYRPQDELQKEEQHNQ
jgi:hypothetical protein